MKTYIQNFKKTLKKQAKQIRELKSKRKDSPYGYVSDLESTKQEFRIGHIAYCLIRGRTKEQIESHHRDPDDPNHKFVWKKAEQIVERAKEEITDEIICVSE